MADAVTITWRPGMTLKDVELQAVRAALESTGGHRDRAAKLLGIGERTVYARVAEMRERGIPAPSTRTKAKGD
jgi:transcriptional regulator with PAS, ATPase and Fis domain